MRPGPVVLEGFVAGEPTLTGPWTGVPCVAWKLRASAPVQTPNGTRFAYVGTAVGESVPFRLADEAGGHAVSIDALAADVATEPTKSELDDGARELRDRMGVGSRRGLLVTEMRIEPNDHVTVFGHGEASPTGITVRATHVQGGGVAQQRANTFRWIFGSLAKTSSRRLRRVRFELARALVERDRDRALALARTAREGLAADAREGETLAELETWLRAHGE